MLQPIVHIPVADAVLVINSPGESIFSSSSSRKLLSVVIPKEMRQCAKFTHEILGRALKEVIAASLHRCHCDAGFSGGDCSLRMCPSGYAWADQATAVNVAHASTECANRGLCDRSTGVNLTLTLNVGFCGAFHIINVMCITALHMYSYADILQQIFDNQFKSQWQKRLSFNCLLSGVCACMEGFIGSACQYLDCPSECSKSGRCFDMKDRAARTM